MNKARKQADFQDLNAQITVEMESNRCYNFCNNYVNKKGKDPMSAIPKDPMILLSYINTQLRDNYSSLEELCQAMDLDEDQIKKTLSDIGFEYEPEQNCFR